MNNFKQHEMCRIEIIHCAETIKGGITTYLRELIPLQASAYGSSAVRLVVPKSQAGEIADVGDTVPFHDGGGRLVSSLRLAAAVIGQIRRHRPSIVHVHSTFAGLFVRPLLALLFPRLKIVYCAHGWAWDRPDGRIAKTVVSAAERRLLRLTSAVVCISRHDYQAALSARLNARLLHVVLNGLNTEGPSARKGVFSWPEDVLRVLYVGRFDHQKGFDVLLEAARLMKSAACIVMAGAPVLADAHYMSLLDERDPRVELVGWQDPSGLAALFESADVVVIPSRWEGFGLVALEAMRAGVAVVASRVGGLAEVVVDDVTGVLVTPGDAAELASVLDQSDRDWDQLGKRGRERFMSEFDIARTFDGLDKIYRSVLGCGPQ